MRGIERFPGGRGIKNPPANAGDAGSVPGVGKIPQRRQWQPTPIFLPGKSQGQRSQVGYSLWGHKTSDMTEHAHTHTLSLKKNPE